MSRSEYLEPEVTNCISKIYQGNSFIVPSPRRVVLIRNCYWHMHACKYGNVKPATNAEFWEKKRTGNKERDKRNIAALKKLGWQVLVVWECQVKDTEQVRERVAQFLSS